MKRQREDEDDGDKLRTPVRQRVTGPSHSASPLRFLKPNSPTPATVPRGKYGDRFVPAPSEDMESIYQLRGTKQQQSRRSRGPATPPDAITAKAESLYSSILRSECVPGTTSPSSLPRTPSKRRVLTYMTPSSPIPSFPSLLDSPVIRKGNTVSDTSNAVLSLGRSPPLRNIPKVPFRVLDAPGMVANFYFDLIDWSAAGMVAVGLDTSVYLWKAYDGPPVVLCDLKPDTVSSVRWSQQSATTLAVGTANGTFHIYDTIELKALRSFTSAHTASIGALTWSGPTIATGSRDHYFRQWDLRERTSEPFRQRTHGKEVCGLKWSLEENSTMLASGGDDNKVCIWDFRGSEPAKPKRQEGLVYTFDEHKAAVKALAWDPHVSGRLASGGGNGDQYIRFWDVRTGENVDSVHTGSQILNLAWSVNSHELVSTHGFASKIPAAQNQVCVWSCPDLTMLASLSGHTDRVLYLAMGPTGETIVTASGDQSVRFWNIFPSKPPPLRKAGPAGLLDSIR